MNSARMMSDLGGLEHPDLAVVRRLAPYRHSPAVQAIDALGKSGDQPPLLAAAGVTLTYALLRPDRCLARQAAHVLASVALATAMKNALKRLVLRLRPRILIEEGRHEVGLFGMNRREWKSMPSGHAAACAAMAQACTHCWPGSRAAVFTAAAALSLA